MRLVDDAEFVLRRAWSVRLIVLAAALSGLEVFFQVAVAFTWLPPFVPPGLFAAASGLVSAAAFGARFIAQKRD